MAITKFLHMGANDDGSIDAHLENAIEYILNPKKLGEANMVGGINCLSGTAYEQMKSTKEFFGKTGGRQGYHMILSLPPGEGTPETMYQIAYEFVEKSLHNEYEALIAVHTDKDHLHAHIIINSVNLITGMKFQYKNGDWKNYYQPITNEICAKYGYEIMPAEYSKNSKNVPRPVWEKKQSFKDLIKSDAYFCAYQAEDIRHFCYLLSRLGYEVKQGEHITVKAKEMKRFRRLDTISEDFARENLEQLIRYGDSSMAVAKTYSLNPIYVKRAKLTPYQKKYYAKLYRLRLIEKKRFSYRSSDYYQQIKLMNQLQEEYLFLCKHDIYSFADLMDLYDNLSYRQCKMSELQKTMYESCAAYKKNPSLDAEVFIHDEAEYRNRLEQIKNEKKEIRKDIQLVERCMKREESEVEKVLEDMIPLDDSDMRDDEIGMDAMGDVQVPENPYKQKLNEGRSIIETSRGAEAITIKELSVESEVINQDIVIEVEQKLPDSLEDYKKLTMDEKIQLFQVAVAKETEVRNTILKYLTTKGADFDTAYEEYNSIIRYYSDRQMKQFVDNEVKKQLDLFELIGLTKEQLEKSTPEMKARVFSFGDVDYSTGMTIYRTVLEKVGIHKGFDELYDEYERIYAVSQGKVKEIRERNR